MGEAQPVGDIERPVDGAAGGDDHVVAAPGHRPDDRSGVIRQSVLVVDYCSIEVKGDDVLGHDLSCESSGCGRCVSAAALPAPTP